MQDAFADLIPRFDLRGMDLQLDRMQAALQAMGSPCAEIPAIQVVGTNGKGSIASFLASALQQAGIRTGLTTSPHLVSWCERIRVDGVPITAPCLRRRLEALHALGQTHRLTPFEQLLAAAFDHFRDEDVDLLVLEVGLGGRLDATTAHPHRPVIAMASIGLDHCEHLGETLTAIAEEKAAVVTPRSTVISAHQAAEVTAVLERICCERRARLQWVDPLPNSWALGIPGSIQRSNAAVARGALRTLQEFGWSVSNQSIRTGFANAHWRGRLQTVSWRERPLRLDGAHNPAAAEQLARERQHWTGQDAGVCWLLAIQAHKQAAEMLHALLQPNDRVWIVPVPEHNSWDRDRLISINPAWNPQLHQSRDAESALIQIRDQGAWPQPPPVVAGSLYLIGDLFRRNLVRAE